MHRTLQGDDALAGRFHAEVAKHFLVGGLAFAAGQHDPHARRLFGAQQRHRSQRHAEAAVHRAGALEVAVAQALDGESAGERRMARHPGQGAQREFDGRSLAGLVGAARRWGVDQQPQHRVGRALAQQRIEQAHRVAIAARSGIVLGIGQDDRGTGRSARTGPLHGLVRCQQFEREILFAGGNRIGQFGHCRLDGPAVVRIADHRHAAFVEVGHRKSGRERQGHAAAFLEAAHQVVQTLAGFDERALRRNAGEEIEGVKGLVEAFAGADQAHQQAGGARAGFGHVHMGIGAVDRQRIGVFDHGPGDVGMQVETGHHRHRRAHDFTHPAQQLAFAIVVMLGDHRTVQVEINAIEAARRFQARDQVVGKALERVLGDMRRGRGGRPRERRQPMAGRAQRDDRALHRNVGPGHRLEQGIALLDRRPAAALHEGLVVRLGRRKGVRLVLQATHRNQSHRCSTPIFTEMACTIAAFAGRRHFVTLHRRTVGHAKPDDRRAWPRAHPRTYR